MISVEEAQRIVLDHIHPMGVERIDLLNALGRVSGEEIKSSRNIPPWDHSAMDGYAVKSSDLKGAEENNPVVLEVVGELAAGHVYKNNLRKGEALRIMTGAPIPQGSDTVVMFESTRTENDLVYIQCKSEEGKNIRRKGEDIREGQNVVENRAHLTPALIGMLASIGRSSIMVHQVPRVAILSTGDELVYLDENLSPGKIVNSNSYSLSTMVKECGAIPVQLGIVKDIKEDLEENLQKSLQSDMIITTGGVSMGRYDYVKDVLNKMGIELKYSKVAMRPGPSQIFGILEGKPVFGLPGNHVSSMVSFELFVRPSILKMMGFPNIFKCIQKAHLKEDLTTKSGKKHFIRGVLEYDKDIRTVTPIRNQGSTVSSSKFNCLIMVPEDAIEIKAGKLVGVLTLDPYFDLQKKQKFNIE